MSETSRKLFLAPFSAHNTTELLLKEALAVVPGPDFRGILYLTPSPRKLRDTQYCFARLCGHAGFIPPEFTTPGRLVRQLYEQTGGPSPLSSALRPILMHRLIPESSPHATLGYARAVADFAQQLKTWGPRRDRVALPALFSEQLAGFEEPLKRALESLNLLERYDAALKSHGLVDEEDIWEPAIDSVSSSGLRLRVLILDGFAAPNPLEAALLSALVKAAPVTLVSCFADDSDGPGYAFPLRFRTFIESLDRFTHERIEADAPPEPQGLYAFADREEEIAGIARYLRDQDDTNDTMVVLPDLGSRAPLVRRVFAQYGIPATLYPETGLDTSLPVIAVLELLEALESDYERLPFTAALSSPWLPGLLKLSTDKGAEAHNRAAAALNQLSRRAGIIKGHKDWWNIAARLAAVEGRPEGETARFAEEMQLRVRRALGLVDKILEPADCIGSQSRRLKAFLEAAQFCNLGPDLPEELRDDRGTLYDLLDELERFDTRFGAKHGSRADFVRTVKYLIGLESRKTEPVPAGVLVVGLSEAVGLHPARLVVGGLTETNLPGSYSADPILPDRLRRRLGLPDMDWHRDRQRFHLLRTMESSPNPAFLSYYDSDEGRPVLPTPFLELEKVSPAKPEHFYSAVEEQLENGSRRAVSFSNQTRLIDFVSDKAIRTALLDRFGPHRHISVTGIEAYRACPHRFYLERVLRLESPPEPQYEIDAAQWGSVVHSTMQELFRDGPVELADLPTRARAAFNEALAKADLPSFWAEACRRVFENILPGIVSIETGLIGEGWKPFRTEHPVRGAVSEDILVKGRLDRTDSNQDGTRLRILDYKTGSASISAKAVLEDRTHVQLPLYARLLAQDKRLDVDNVGVYSLRDARVRWLADDKRSLKELIKAAVETTMEVVAGIRAGRFPAEPARDDVCRNCDYAYLCGEETGAEE